MPYSSALLLPSRPAIPPVLICALSLWAGCALAFNLASSWTVSACIIISILALILAIVSATIMWRARSLLLVSFLALGFFAGIMCGSASAAQLHTQQKSAAGEPSADFRFEAVEDGRAGLFGSTCAARTTLSSGQSINVQLHFDKDAALPSYGDVFEVHVSLAMPKPSQLERCWQQSIAAQATVQEMCPLVRHDMLGILLDVRSRAVSLLGERAGEGGAVLQALLCGDRTALDKTDVYESFKVTGLAHLIAVSGAHLVIVCAFVGVMLKALRAPRVLFLGIQLGLVLCYLVFTAAPISAIRATIMVAVGMFSFFAQRRSSSLNALGVCIIALIALSPSTALSVSFLLSAFSTLGIVLFTGLLSAWCRCFLPWLPSFVVEALSLTFASSILAQPLSSALFSQISLVSPLANVLTAPLFPFICAGGLVAIILSMFIASVGGVALSVVVGATEALCAVVRFCAGIPYASLPVNVSFGVALGIAVLLSVGLWLWWPKPRLSLGVGFVAATAVLLVAMVGIAPRLSETEIIMLNVGQGDAFVIRSEGVAVLVDTGNQDKLLREALARHGIFHLDGVIVTHGDDDHCGSLATLKGIVQIDRVLVATGALSCECAACASLRASSQTLVGKDSLAGLVVGDVMRVGKFQVKVIAPQEFVEEGAMLIAYACLCKPT